MGAYTPPFFNDYIYTMRTKLPFIFLITIATGMAGIFVLFLITQDTNQISEPKIETAIPHPTISAFIPVLRVVDGDTIKISVNNTTDTIRLIGMDSPETVDPKKPVQCFGKEASQKMNELVLGKPVRLAADATQGDKDKYGRLLRFVFLEDGTDVEKVMIQEGYAFEYTYDAYYKYRAEYKIAEEYARNNKLGLWNPLNCTTKDVRGRLETAYPTR